MEDGISKVATPVMKCAYIIYHEICEFKSCFVQIVCHAVVLSIVIY